MRHRLAHIADLPAIVAIYNATIASREVTADTEPISVASRLEWFAQHNPERRPLWVIDDAEPGQIVGWLSYSNFYGRPAYSGTAELSIYIREDQRGKGLGSYFLTEAIAFAPQISVYTLLGFIFGHNASSLRLFDRFGFARWANLPCVARLDEIERDLVIVGRRVG